MSEIVVYLLGFWLGAVFTSYFSVATTRGIKNSFFGRSRCDSCGKDLSPVFMVPIFSIAYLKLFNKGRSFCCNKPLSIKYLFTEALGAISGILFANYLIVNEFHWAAFILVICGVLFLYMAIEDIWHLEITILPLIMMVAIILVAALVSSNETKNIWENQVLSANSLIAGLFFAAVVSIFIIISKGKGLGIGDIFIVFFIGLNLGWLQGIVAVQLSIYIATIFGLSYAAFLRQFKGVIIPLVPFLFFGWLLAINYAGAILEFFLLR